MAYYFSTLLHQHSMAEAIEIATQALKTAGFGVLHQIDMQHTLHEKIGVHLPDYVILAACQPHHAYEALQHEPMIGLMLPCNVVVAAQADGSIQVAAIDPVASMAAVENPALAGMATQVQQKMKDVIDTVAANAVK